MHANTKPKVLIVLNRLVIGGQTIDTISLAYHLQAYFEVKVLYGEKKKDDTDANFLLTKYPMLDIQKIPELNRNLNILNDLKAYQHISKIIKAFKPSIVHTNGAKAGMLARLAAKKNNIPVIIQTFHGHFFHSYYNKIISQSIVIAERWFAKFTTQIIATSNQQYNDLVKIYRIANEEKVSTINLGIEDDFVDETIDSSEFAKKYELTDDVIAIGIIARITPVKNFSLFVNVAKSILAQTNKTIKFFVIGDGVSKKEIQKKLSSNNILWCNDEDYQSNANVIFTSWMADVRPAINAMDIIILTSHNEGTGLSLAEGQLYKKPVVATNVGGVADCVINNQTGFLVEPNNAITFANKLLALINDKALRQNMGLNAFQFAKTHFSKKNQVEKTKTLYQNLLMKIKKN